MNWKDVPLKMPPRDLGSLAPPRDLGSLAPPLWEGNIIFSTGIPKHMIYLVSDLETVALDTRTGEITTIKDSNSPNP